MSLSYYKIYGLDIESEIELPAIQRINKISNVDVKILIDEDIQKPKGFEESGYWSLTQNVAFFSINDTLDCSITNGCNIRVNPKGSKNDVCEWILYNAFGAIAHQRSWLPLHGSAMAKNGKVLIFSGPSGVGKSTLATYLNKVGWTFISDDSTFCKKVNDNWITSPGLSRVKLFGDSIGKISTENDNWSKVDHKEGKFQTKVKINDHSSVEVGAFIRLFPFKIDKISLKLVKPLIAIDVLKKNAYRRYLSRSNTYKKDYLNSCMDFAFNVPVYRLFRPEDEYNLEKLESFIEENFFK